MSDALIAAEEIVHRTEHIHRHQVEHKYQQWVATKGAKTSAFVRAHVWRLMSRRYNRLIEKHVKQHPKYKEPKDDCQSCHGTGKVTTNRNPASRWDWYVIGGRLHDKGDMRGPILLAKDRPRAVVPYSEDWCQVAPYAYISLDGLWHERGELGWWGISLNEVNEKKWAAEYNAWLDADPHMVTALIDYHI